MYVDPWLFWLIFAPIAAACALYLGYLALLLLGLLSLTVGVGFAMASDWLTRLWPTCFICSARTATWILTPLVAPFRQYGPWLDYAVVAGAALAISLGGILWLAV